MKSSKSNLLVTFILLIGLSVAVVAFLSFVAVKIAETGIKYSDENAFYYADAGMNKAYWLLATTVGNGGRGTNYRITGSYEAIGKGDYRYSIITVSSYEVKIVCTGETGVSKKMISQHVSIGGYPQAFKYALYGGANTTLVNNVAVTGNVYINGNLTNGTGALQNVYHPAGTTISGGGSWIELRGSESCPRRSNI